MSNQKMTITWNDVNSDQVDRLLQRQQALNEAHAHFVAQHAAARQSGQTLVRARGGWLYRGGIYMALFGLLGGLLAWAASEAFSTAVPNRYQEIQQVEQEQLALRLQMERGELLPMEAEARVQGLFERHADSPYISILRDETLDPAERQQRIQERLEQDRVVHYVHRLIWYSIVGVMLAIAVGCAEQIVSRNWRNAAVTAGVAMIVAVFGAALISLFINHIYEALGGGTVGIGLKRQMLARTVVWTLFGLFLCLAPGLVLRSPKKLFIGLIGGAIGGFVGGLCFDPVDLLAGSDALSRLVAFLAIGVGVGWAVGLIETAVKTGWLRVTTGLIAGKQFIIYKNPTYLGASPLCEIYLFRDPKVSQHHAAIHAVRGGYEIEDLNRASQTFVNGEPILRSRLRAGDEVRIGQTTLIFLERKQAVSVG